MADHCTSAPRCKNLQAKAQHKGIWLPDHAARLQAHIPSLLPTQRGADLSEETRTAQSWVLSGLYTLLITQPFLAGEKQKVHWHAHLTTLGGSHCQGIICGSWERKPHFLPHVFCFHWVIGCANGTFNGKNPGSWHACRVQMQGACNSTCDQYKAVPEWNLQLGFSKLHCRALNYRNKVSTFPNAQAADQQIISPFTLTEQRTPNSSCS